MHPLSSLFTLKVHISNAGFLKLMQKKGAWAQILNAIDVSARIRSEYLLLLAVAYG